MGPRAPWKKVLKDDGNALEDDQPPKEAFFVDSAASLSSSSGPGNPRHTPNYPPPPPFKPQEIFKRYRPPLVATPVDDGNRTSDPPIYTSGISTILSRRLAKYTRSRERRPTEGPPPPWWSKVRKSVIEIAFNCLIGCSPRIKDESFFEALDLFDQYFVSHPLSGRNSQAQKVKAVELMVASLLLATKEHSIRHVSLKTCFDAINPSISISKSKVLSNEVELFIKLGDYLGCPTACQFIQANFRECGEVSHQRDSSDGRMTTAPAIGGGSPYGSFTKAYHLAVYVLALNIAKNPVPHMDFTAAELGHACTWIALVLCQHLPSKSLPLQQNAVHSIARKMHHAEWICRQVAYRAFVSCREPDSSINRYFATLNRLCARDALVATTHTTFGSHLLDEALRSLPLQLSTIPPSG